jgi:hypothetical protein
LETKAFRRLTSTRERISAGEIIGGRIILPTNFPILLLLLLLILLVLFRALEVSGDEKARRIKIRIKSKSTIGMSRCLCSAL